MASNELNQLRQEVEKRRKAASAKISRIKTTHGAHITGTEYDPRRKAGVEKRYNAAQLRSYLNQLNDFTHRSKQFVGLAGGVPAPRGRWNVFNARQQEQERIRQAHDAMMNNIKTPTGMTIAGNKEMLHQGAGAAVFGPYKKMDYQPSDIKNLGALEKLSSDMLRRVSPKFLAQQLALGKQQLSRALGEIGQTTVMINDEEVNLLQLIKDMNDYQFDAFWFGSSGYVENVFMAYGMMQDNNITEGTTEKEKKQSKVVDDAINELGPVLQHFAEISPTERTPEPSEKTGIRRSKGRWA